MKKIAVLFFKLIIPLSIAILLLYYAFQNVDFKSFWLISQEANYWWVATSIGLGLLSYITRAYRWKLLLNPIGYNVGTFRITLAILAGYLANIAFPRLGEVTRCAVLSKTNKVPVTISLGTVVTERIIDTLTLLFLVGLSFILEYDLIMKFFSEILEKYDLNFSSIVLMGSIASILLLIVLVFLYLSQNRFSEKLKNILRDLFAGISSIRKVHNISAFIISTIVLWITYYLMSYIIVFSLEATSFLPVSAGFMLLVTGGIAVALPVQGGIGTYHALVSYMLFLYGIDKTTGVFLATLLHTSQLVSTAIFGGIAIIITMFIVRQRDHGFHKG